MIRFPFPVWEKETPVPPISSPLAPHSKLKSFPFFSFKILPMPGRPGSNLPFFLRPEGGKETKGSMVKVKGPSTLAAGVPPWMRRLRSYHETPQSSPPQRPHSGARSSGAAKEAQTSKSRAASKIPRRGGSQDENAGAARPLKAPTRRSPRLAGRDPEHSIVIDEADKVGGCSCLEYLCLLGS
jgi:hypothetical protein